MDIARLGIEVDTRRVRAASTDLDTFTDRGRRAESQAQQLGRATDQLGAVARRAAGALAAAFSVREVLQAADSYTRMTNALRATGMEAGQAAATLDQIAGIAQRTRAPLEATAQLYQRVSMASRDLGASSADVVRFTENIGLALAQTGAAAGSASGALLQLSQAMGAGTVRAEEFNSILEGAYPIALAAARGIDAAGGSVARLRQLVIEGKISSDEFFQAILSQTDQLEAAFADTVPTIAGALTSLSTSFTMLVGGMDGAAGVTSTIAKGILVLADNLDRVVVIAATAAVAYGVTYAGAMALAAARTMTLAGALVTLRGALIRTGIGALVVGAGEAAYRIGELSKRVGGFGEAMSLLGDVAGAVWQGIIDSAAAIPVGLKGVWSSMKGGFMVAISDMLWAWRDFIMSVSTAAADIASIEILGVKPFAGLDAALAEAANNVARTSNDILEEGMNLQNTANASFGEAGAIISGAFSGVGDAVAALGTTVEGASGPIEDGAGSAEALAAALAGADGSGGAAGAADAASKSIRKLQDEAKQLNLDADPVRKYAEEVAHLDELLSHGLTAAGYAKAIEDLNDELASSLPMVDDLARAFEDWIAGTAGNFRDMLSDMFGAFRRWLANMIATAARNKIMVSMGLGGAGSIAGTAASAAPMGGGGVLSGILGSFGAAGGGIFGALGGGTGFLGGLGNAVSGGLGNVFNIAANGMGTLAGTLGAAVPVLGAVAAAVSFFRSKTKLLDAGIRVTTKNMDALVETFEQTKTSRFWGLRTNTDTDYDPAGKGLSNPLTKAVSEIQEGVLEAADALGVGKRAFRGFTHEIKLSTKDMSREEALQAIQKRLGGLSDAFARMVPGLRRVKLDGESATDTLTRVSNALVTTNSTLQTLGHESLGVSVAAGRIASRLTEMVGGIENFANAAEYYFQNFYTLGERTKEAAKQFRQSVRSLGVDVIPQTERQFRRVVDRLMENGRRAAAVGLMALAPLFGGLQELRAEAEAAGGAVGDVISERAMARQVERQGLREELWRVQGRTEKLRKAELEALFPANRALRERYHRLLDEREATEKANRIADERKSIQERIWELRGREDLIRKRELRELDPANRALQERYYRLLDEKKAADEAAAAAERFADQLRAAQAALDPDSFTSRLDFLRARVRVGVPAEPSLPAQKVEIKQTEAEQKQRREDAKVMREVRDLLGNMERTSFTTARIHRQWDKKGLPPERAA